MKEKFNRKNMFYAAAGFAAAALLTAAISLYFHNKRNYIEIIAVTGATPIAIKEDVPGGFSLNVTGYTEKDYVFNRKALNAFASVYLRTLEVSPQGEFEGTYRYTAVPVLHILEGVAPEKPEGAPFDRPLDMVVTFVSKDGEKRHFSYGEITMTDDTAPVVLAYSREELLPTKPPEDKPYDKNIHKGPLTGLRLVCPAEPDTTRYLDNVVKIVLSDPVVDAAGLPELKPGIKCSSDSLTAVRNGTGFPVNFSGVEKASIEKWVRTGHGRGFKGISSASGYNLRTLLKRNFPDAGPDKFFMFIACDGYRTLLSGIEIFSTEDGAEMMLIKEMDGRLSPAGPRLGPVKDYYVDREVWGLTHIIMLDDIR